VAGFSFSAVLERSVIQNHTANRGGYILSESPS
jgi:hypothetical protein